MKRGFLIQTLFATIAFGAVAAVPFQDSATVRLDFTKAGPVKYRSTVKTDMDFMGMAQSTTIVMTQGVETLSSDSEWTTVRIKTTDFKLDGDGMMGMEGSIESAKDVSIKVDVDAQGRTRNIVLENTEKLDPMMRQLMTGSMKSDQVAGFMGIHFPKSAVQTGTKWAAELDASQMFDQSELVKEVSGKLPISYEVVGFESIKGKRQVKVHSTMAGTITMDISSPAGDMKAVVKMEFATDYWVDVDSGVLSKSVGKATIDNDFGMGSMTQKLSVAVERVD